MRHNEKKRCKLNRNSNFKLFSIVPVYCIPLLFSSTDDSTSSGSKMLQFSRRWSFNFRKKNENNSVGATTIEQQHWASDNDTSTGRSWIWAQQKRRVRKKSDNFFFITNKTQCHRTTIKTFWYENNNLIEDAEGEKTSSHVSNWLCILNYKQK